MTGPLKIIGSIAFHVLHFFSSIIPGFVASLTCQVLQFFEFNVRNTEKAVAANRLLGTFISFVFCEFHGKLGFKLYVCICHVTRLGLPDKLQCAVALVKTTHASVSHNQNKLFLILLSGIFFSPELFVVVLRIKSLSRDTMKRALLALQNHTILVQ